jgi:hypothetical protein
MTRRRPFSCQSERPARASGTPPGRDICHRTRGQSSRISAVRSRELDHGQLAGASGRGVVAAAVRPQAARSALDDVGVASAPAPAGIDVLHLNAAVLRRPGPPVPPSSTCPFAGKDPSVAQLRWQKAAYGSDTLAMAQIRWRRTSWSKTPGAVLQEGACGCLIDQVNASGRCADLPRRLPWNPVLLDQFLEDLSACRPLVGSHHGCRFRCC